MAEETPTPKKQKPAESAHAARPAVPVKKIYYRPVMWKGVKQVFQCAECKTCRDEEDSIILHVLVHYPQREQEKIFDQIMKEK